MLTLGTADFTFSSAITELLLARHAAALEQIGIILKLETSPFTQNNHYLSDVTAKTLSRYKDIREGKTQSGAGRPGKSFANSTREGEIS